MLLTNRFRPNVETLEDRITPSVSEGGVATLKGVLVVMPPAAQVSHPPININQQVSHITLPSGDVVPGHGLKTAEVRTPVVNWTPTGPA